MRLPRLLSLRWLMGAVLLFAACSAGAATLDVPTPYIPSTRGNADEMLRLAAVTPNDVVYDLGSGDGRIVIAAARDYGARGVGIDILTDQTSAHDPEIGYIPHTLTNEQANVLREKNPEHYTQLSYESMHLHVQLMLQLMDKGAITFDYGNNIRARAQEYEQKINSGDLMAIAEVVRDLHRTDDQREQSYSERQLYEAALERLTREVAAVAGTDEAGAQRQVGSVLLSRAA